MADVFNNFDNPTNNFAYPELSPCVNAQDKTYLEFFQRENIGITSGQKTLSKISFLDFKIPINSWTQETKIMEPGEVAYISGLNKGLMQETHYYNIPDVNSSNLLKNKFFMMIDASVSYYKNFTDFNKNIDVSSNYSTNLAIDDAINILFDDEGVPLTCDYQDKEKRLKIIANQAGLDYDITNVSLTLIDASIDPQSPFDASVVDGIHIPQTFTLTEDKDAYIPPAKYPNGGFRGIILRAEYPQKYNSEDLNCEDKWFYIHHIKNNVKYYEEKLLEPIKDVSLYYEVNQDSSIYNYLGISKPIFTIDFSLNKIDCSIDVSAGPYPDTSTFGGNTIGVFYNDSLYDTTLDNSTAINYNLIDVSVRDSSVIDSYIRGGDSQNSYSEGNIIEDTSIRNVETIDSSLYHIWIFDSSLGNNYFFDSSLGNISGNGGNIYDNSFLKAAQASQDTFLCSDVDDSIINSGYLRNSLLSDSSVSDSSILQTEIFNSFIDSSSQVEDSSIYASENDHIEIKNSYIEDSSTINSKIYDLTLIKRGSLQDSSIKNSYMEEDVSIRNSYIDTTWINSDEDFDSSIYRVNIRETKIWDASIRNANIYDSSIYNTILYDVSAYNCTLVNSNLRNVYRDPSTKTILIDPSISSGYIYDPSTYYEERDKKLNVGAIQSTSKIIGAKNYLTLINERNEWNKIGELYAWTAPVEAQGSTANLINGMYIYNPHDYRMRINYILIG